MPHPNAFVQTLSQADQLARQGQLEQAAGLYRALLAAQPHQFDTLLRLGMLEFQRGQAGAALRLLTLASQVNPGAAGALSALGYVQASLDRHAEALESFNRALSIQPDFVEALYRRGKSLYALKRLQSALEDFEAVLRLDPRDVLALFNHALALRSLGRPSQALDSLDRALALKPDFVEALFHRGVTLQDLSRPAEAVASYDRALALRPQFAEALNNRGNGLEVLGQAEAALASYERALSLRPDYADALNNRGRILTTLNRLAEALESYNRALALQPDDPAILANRGALLRVLLRPAEALADHERALRLKPDYGPALNNRGAALHDLGRLDEALASYDRALEVDPRDVEALNNRGNVLRALERPREAMESLDLALSINPQHAESHCNRGLLLAELGRLEEAVAAIEQAIAIAPHRARYYYSLAETKRIVPGDPHIQTLRAMVRSIDLMPEAEQIDLRFALSKALADIGEREDSFSHLIAGNGLKRRRLAYDEAAVLADLEEMASAFSEAGSHAPRGGAPSALPVFIVGMPRSGTTLIEQILASHPSVHAAGETDAWAVAIRRLGGQTLLQSPGRLAALDADQLAALGADYVGRLRAMAPDALRVVNKTPDNFRFVGLIYRALPQARIIHSRRDPIDTCLSCFTKRFTGHLPYAFDLAELGRYHRAYQELMSHWRTVVPPQVMLEVDYEAVVDDLEREARRILAHCGLEWDPRCLDFHLTERQVRTASAVQVRQPLYAAAVGRAKPYRALLGPLIEGLGGHDRVDS